MKVTHWAKKPFNNPKSEALSAKQTLMSKTRASTIYHQLIEEGCLPKDIISLSTHLISLVTTDLKMNK